MKCGTALIEAEPEPEAKNPWWKGP
jgi:hypothetical protein